MGVQVARQQIEQTILEQLRLSSVNLGYLPDVNSFLPKTPASQASYEAARNAIVGGGKEVVEPTGVTSSKRRGELKANNLFINMRQINPGSVDLWGDYTQQVTQSPDTYQKSFIATSCHRILYDIRTVVKSVKYDRLLTQVILQGLTASHRGRALNIWVADPTDPNNNPPTLDTTRFFWVRFVTQQEIKTRPFFERLYTFEIVDVWIDDWEPLPYIENIVSLQQIDVDGVEEGKEELLIRVQ